MSVTCSTAFLTTSKSSENLGWPASLAFQTFTSPMGSFSNLNIESVGTNGGIRTHTSFRTEVFETSASAVPPHWHGVIQVYLYHTISRVTDRKYLRIELAQSRTYRCKNCCHSEGHRKPQHSNCIALGRRNLLAWSCRSLDTARCHSWNRHNLPRNPGIAKCKCCHHHRRH